MGALLTIDVQTDEVEAFFRELGARAKTPAPVLFVGRSLVEEIQGNIDREDGGPFGPWPALRPFTVEERERLGYGGAHPMLIREHDLYNSITFSPTGPESVEAGPDGSAWYAADHDLGNGQSQRAYVWIGDAKIEGWLGAIGDFLVDGKPFPEPR